MSIANKNLICKKRRWIGQRIVCRDTTKSHKIPSTLQQQQQCDSYEAQKCEQLCIKNGNRTEAVATCHCHKGFHLIGTRCLGKLKTLFLLLLSINLQHQFYLLHVSASDMSHFFCARCIQNKRAIFSSISCYFFF